MRTVILVLFAAIAAPAYADVHVSVHGGLDRERLRDQLAGELGVAVTLAGDACVEPCLDVRVDGSEVTVSFSPRSGAPRTRTVALGDDRAQWPLLVTLLASNLVHDEAASLLAAAPDEGPVLAPQPDDVQLPPVPELAMPPDGASGPVLADVASGGAAPHVVSGVAAPTESAPTEWAFISVGLVPGLSTDSTHIGEVRHFVSLSAIAGLSAGSSGLALSGIVDIQRDRVSGFQGAGIATIGGHLSGIQLAGIAAVSDDLEGVQLGGIAAVAAHVDGIQAAGIAAFADRADHQIAGIATVSDGAAGWQLAGIGAVANDVDVQLAGIGAVADGKAVLQVAGIGAVADSVNVQLAGIGAVADRGSFQIGGIASVADHGGIQIGGIASVADDASVQLAGLANAADRAHLQIAGLVNVADAGGLQIAPINVASSGSGTQIGILNIAGSAESSSFGLINIVPGGRYDLEAAVDSGRIGTLLFRHGGVGWHNVYGIGGQSVSSQGPNDDIWMYGLGFGPSWQLHGSRLDLEAIAWEVNHGARHETDVSTLAQLRLSLAFGIGSLALVVGGELNTYISDDMQSPLMLERRSVMPTSNAITTTTWPSAFVGVRL